LGIKQALQVGGHLIRVLEVEVMVGAWVPPDA